MNGIRQLTVFHAVAGEVKHQLFLKQNLHGEKFAVILDWPEIGIIHNFSHPNENITTEKYFLETDWQDLPRIATFKPKMKQFLILFWYIMKTPKPMYSKCFSWHFKIGLPNSASPIFLARLHPDLLSLFQVIPWQMVG